jgi:hypothetical protein
MSKELLTRKPLPKISILFDENDNALACRDILSWYAKSTQKKQIINEFDVTTIAYWLLDHHIPFQRFYDRPPESHTSYPNRIQSKRPYIKNRLSMLVELNLIEVKGKKPADRGMSEKQVYAFTEEGHLWSWLIEAKYASDNNRRSVALNNFFGELSAYVSNSNTSFTDSFIEYVEKCTSQGLVPELYSDHYFDYLVHNLYPLTQNYFRFFRFTFLMGLYTNEDTSRILLEIIEDTDEDTQKLILTQLKLDIESNYYDEMNTSKDWELARYDNLSDHNVITLQGYCLDCKSLWPFTWKTLDFLKQGNKPHCYSPDGQMRITAKIICPNCNKPNSRFGVPVLYVPTRAFSEKHRISPEDIEKDYDIIQTRTPRIQKATLIEDEQQKIVDDL